jgi:uncharacterized membrane protein
MTTATPPGSSASPLDRHASPVGTSGRSRRATVALVLGILSVLTFLIPIVGLILGIIAMVIGLTARSDCRRKDRGTPWQATAGYILGGLGTLLSVGLWVAAIIASN